MSGRPRRACRRCNTQKVRCNGARPSCQRCQRLNHSCVYEGAALAGGDGQLGGASTSNSSTLPGSERAGSPLSPGKSFARVPYSELPTIQDGQYQGDGSYLGIPPTLVGTLISVYFSHIYNAPLLMNKTSLLHALRTGTLRPHILLSICAFASKFYRDEYGRHAMVDWGFSREWADRAGRLVASELVEPEEENIVTFLNLALFWYGEGEWRKTFIYKCNGVQLGHLLGLAIDRKDNRSEQDQELSRRRSWACFLITAFGADTPFVREPSDPALRLSLPCPEDQLESPLLEESLCCLNNTHRDGSVYGELVRIMALWTEVYLLVKDVESDLSSRLSAIEKLDSKISEWRSAIPQSLDLSPETLSQLAQDTLPIRFLIYVVYHQCRCTLHSSIVPLFSWTPSTAGYSYARHISAQIAFEHANSVSSLLNAALQHAWDVSRIPSYIGYAAYCACAIQFPFLWCSNGGVRERARQNVVVNLTMIRHLGRYWKFVALLGVNARALYTMHAKYPSLLDNEPRLMDVGNLDGRRARVNANRARLSILSHNDILAGASGAMAQQDREVTDLGLEDQAQNKEIALGDGAMASFITEISSPQNASHGTSSTNLTTSTPGMTRHQMPTPSHHDEFQPFLDPTVFNGGFSLLPLGQEATCENMQSFDDWLSEVGVDAGGWDSSPFNQTT